MSLLWFFLLALQDERLVVDYVILDVVARDAQGNIVKDLQIDDFEIRDGRKKLNPTNFQVIDFTKPPPPEDPDPVQQTLILLFDLGALSPERISSTIGDVQVFLEHQRDRQDLQMFAFSMDIGVVSKQFTTSAMELIDDLTALESKLMAKAEEEPQHRQPLAALEDDMSKCFSGNLSTSELLRSTEVGGAPGVRPCLENSLNMFTRKQIQSSTERFAVMERFLLFLARIPGLKSVYVISPGWSYNPGEAANEMVRGFINLQKDITTGDADPSVRSSGSFSRSEETTPFSSAHFQMSMNTQGLNSLEAAYQRISHLALQNRVVMHSLFLVSAENRSKADIANPLASRINNDRAYFVYNKDQEEGPSQLARYSGGRHQQARQIDAALKDTLDAYRHYYVLAYPKPKARKKKPDFRKVKVTCKRKDVTIQHRMGYFPISE